MSVVLDDPLADLDETVFLSCVALISAEARALDGASPNWDAKLFDSPVDHRIGRRLPVTKHVKIAVRNGTLGLGPNLGDLLIDVAEDGLGLRVREPLLIGKEITVDMSLPGISKPLQMVAEVRWCRRGEASLFRAGVRLRRRLPYTALTSLAR